MSSTRKRPKTAPVFKLPGMQSTFVQPLLFKAMVHEYAKPEKENKELWQPGQIIATAREQETTLGFPGREEKTEETDNLYPPMGARWLRGIQEELQNNGTRTWTGTLNNLATRQALADVLDKFNIETGDWLWLPVGGRNEEMKGGWAAEYTANLAYRDGMAKAKKDDKIAEAAVLARNKREQKTSVVDLRGAHINKWMQAVYLRRVYNLLQCELWGIPGAEKRMKDSGYNLISITVLFFGNRSVVFTYHKDTANSEAKPSQKPTLTAVVQLTPDHTSMRVAGASKEAWFTEVGTYHAFPSAAYHRSGTATNHTVKVTFLWSLSPKPTPSAAPSEESAEAKIAARGDAHAAADEEEAAAAQVSADADAAAAADAEMADLAAAEATAAEAEAETAKAEADAATAAAALADVANNNVSTPATAGENGSGNGNSDGPTTPPDGPPLASE